MKEKKERYEVGIKREQVPVRTPIKKEPTEGGSKLVKRMATAPVMKKEPGMNVFSTVVGIKQQPIG